MKFQRRKKRFGFTMVEMIIATTISSFVMLGMFYFFRDSHRLLFTMEGKNVINNNMRSLLNELIDEADSADGFIIYTDFTTASINAGRLADGQAGDFLVIVTHADRADRSVVADRPIEKIVGYFRTITNNTEKVGPVRRFEIVATGTVTDSQIATLIPSPSTAANYPTVIELSRGFASGRLFYNLGNNRTMVNGQIYHGNEAKEVTDTFNFTVTYKGGR